MDPSATTAGPPHVERVPGDPVVLRLSGRLVLADAERLWRDVGAALDQDHGPVRVDLSGVETLDGGTAAVLQHLFHEREQAGRAIDIGGANADVQALIDRFGIEADATPLRAAPARAGTMEQVGRFTLDLIESMRGGFAFVGEMSRAIVAAVRQPSTIQWRDIPYLTEKVGADGVPIVCLISFLVGLITAYSAAVQLHKFGADIFVADAVALGMVREMGPLMTAIIVASRTGAGYAAELGTMAVNEEIDALRTLGLCPYRYLVVPRTIAVIIALPLLTILADVLGMLGGAVIGLGYLDITTSAWVKESHKALNLGHFAYGMLKPPVFAVIIGLVACERGLSTRGGAEGVGRSTTSAVVTSLLMLVIATAVFTVLGQQIGFRS